MLAGEGGRRGQDEKIDEFEATTRHEIKRDFLSLFY